MRYLLLLAFSLFVSLTLHAADAYVDAKTGFVFPSSIASFDFEKVNDYGDSRLGYGLNYWSNNNILATVIVYDLGIKNILDGTNGPHVRQQISNAKSDINQAVELSYYKSAEVIDSVKGFSPDFLSASYNIVRQDNVTRRSHLFIRGQNKYFVKVRVTGPAAGNIDALAADFIEQLSVILASKQN